MVLTRSIVFLVLAVIIGFAFRYTRDRRLNDLSIYDAANWWNSDGPFGPLSRMNAVRVPYFLARFPAGVSEVIDVGCGGGIVSEAIALAGFNVTGFDVSEGALASARTHAKANNVSVTYRSGSIYALPVSASSIDVVVVSDVFEHLEDVPAALAEVRRVLKPGGVLVFDTIARTYWSWLSTYFVAQEVLGLIAPGAHDWNMFIQPTELETMLMNAGFTSNRSEWSGLVPELSLVDAMRERSLFKLIRTFYIDESDFSASYMGFAWISSG
jgi:2-polyprenyl-6-hydroxyphenyl methylase/3-demethylubiquinone-9 3-methyltransferase